MRCKAHVRFLGEEATATPLPYPTQGSIEVHTSNRRQAMKPTVERGRRGAAWLGVACLGLLPVSSLSAQEPKLRATLQGHTNPVVSVAFSPDGKTLASASYDGMLKLWDMTTGKERATLGEYRGCLGC